MFEDIKPSGLNINISSQTIYWEIIYKITDIVIPYVTNFHHF